MKNTNQGLLIIVTKVFIDPHGSEDEGGVEKFVTRDQKYLKMNNKYHDGYEEIEELQASEDGYNSEYDFYKVKKITDEQYKSYEKIIKDYNKL